MEVKLNLEKEKVQSLEEKLANEQEASQEYENTQLSFYRQLYPQEAEKWEKENPDKTITLSDLVRSINEQKESLKKQNGEKDRQIKALQEKLTELERQQTTTE
ncbi:MAG: hypothetical protein I3270_00315 [Candidatus Moeniiplasma glomeromycotorum]|nr:hypothetical protein [Candidatus Moeniiplasma glomeromycotorum]MCE8162261.1 hypothetical protein [Candidatus Moeniiplasma glomeromycotorum]MCE8166083.1 hypothetical protein [Candidatus Moeniiplasma glomeromycotorum]MCE8166660.1 hypothetical protein [Candidatus Moeniiplasma glomeromycotorum]